MRFLLSFLVAASAVAQAPAPTEAAAPSPAQEPAANPAPSTDEWLTGSVDLGYRWLTGMNGNFQAYRSVINLGEGPKLFGLDFTILDPKQRLFDRLDARGSGWGGDPYNTAHVDVRKSGLYRLSFDYRNLAYFNALPSFANPGAPGGFDEQAFDVRRRMTTVSLDLFPGKRIVPYLVFDRNSGYGHGIDTWLTDAANEYPVASLLRDSTNNYRGGVRFEYNRFHGTMEQGGTTFKNDDQADNNQANPGDRTTPFLGQGLVLNSLQQAYGIRGQGIYERALFTASPMSWIDFSGQFLFSQPKVDVTYTDLAGGNLALANPLLFYSGELSQATGTAKQPHVSGNAGFEMRPFRRVRIVESWMTDRYHDAAFGLFSQLLDVKTAATTVDTALLTEQVVNYNQQQVDVTVDLPAKLTLRGGYRYVWGDAVVRAGQLSQIGSFASGDLRRSVGLAGLTFRPSEKLSMNLDYEAAGSDRVYFRTSLNDYHKVRARARYQATASLSVQANFLLLNNQNPAAGVQSDFQSRDNSLAVYWTPNGGKRITVTGEYDRSTLRSNIGYLSLPFFNPAVSGYRENAHEASSAVDLMLPGYGGMTPQVTVGGSLFISNGSRPTRFYEPLGRLSLPVRKNVSWNTEWRWYGMGEGFYLYEGFRTHVFMTGLRITR